MAQITVTLIILLLTVNVFGFRWFISGKSEASVESVDKPKTWSTD